MANLCFMALESENKVPSTSKSSCDDYCEYDDDETSIANKLMHKYFSLFFRKKFYKYKFTSLTNKFEDLKIEFSKLSKSNDKLVNDLKTLNSLEDQLKKANDENQKLSK